MIVNLKFIVSNAAKLKPGLRGTDVWDSLGILLIADYVECRIIQP